MVQKRSASWLTKKYAEKGPLAWKGPKEKVVMRLTGAKPTLRRQVVHIPTPESARLPLVEYKQIGIMEGLRHKHMSPIDLDSGKAIKFHPQPREAFDLGWELTQAPRTSGVMVQKIGPTTKVYRHFVGKGYTPMSVTLARAGAFKVESMGGKQALMQIHKPSLMTAPYTPPVYSTFSTLFPKFVGLLAVPTSASISLLRKRTKRPFGIVEQATKIESVSPQITVPKSDLAVDLRPIVELKTGLSSFSVVKPKRKTKTTPIIGLVSWSEERSEQRQRLGGVITPSQITLPKISQIQTQTINFKQNLESRQAPKIKQDIWTIQTPMLTPAQMTKQMEAPPMSLEIPEAPLPKSPLWWLDAKKRKKGKKSDLFGEWWLRTHPVGKSIFLPKGFQFDEPILGGKKRRKRRR